jgi:hypothetical protein
MISNRDQSWSDIISVRGSSCKVLLFFYILHQNMDALTRLFTDLKYETLRKSVYRDSCCFARIHGRTLRGSTCFTRGSDRKLDIDSSKMN